MLFITSKGHACIDKASFIIKLYATFVYLMARRVTFLARTNFHGLSKFSKYFKRKNFSRSADSMREISSGVLKTKKITLYCTRNLFQCYNKYRTITNSIFPLIIKIFSFNVNHRLFSRKNSSECSFMLE